MGNILALDLGEKRIGVARADDVARLPEALTTLANDSKLLANLKALIKTHDVTTLVIGLPRGMQGQTTAQTQTIKVMAAKLQKELGLEVHWQDETLTSYQAEQELKSQAVRYNKAAVDALAAFYILEDFLRSHPR